MPTPSGPLPTPPATASAAPGATTPSAPCAPDQRCWIPVQQRWFPSAFQAPAHPETEDSKSGLACTGDQERRVGAVLTCRPRVDLATRALGSHWRRRWLRLRRRANVRPSGASCCWGTTPSRPGRRGRSESSTSASPGEVARSGLTRGGPSCLCADRGARADIDRVVVGPGGVRAQHRDTAARRSGSRGHRSGQRAAAALRPQQSTRGKPGGQGAEARCADSTSRYAGSSFSTTLPSGM